MSIELAAALITFGMERLLVGKVAAVSVGMVGGANLLDLVEKTLDACVLRIDDALPAVRQLEDAIQQQRSRLAAQLAGQIRTEGIITHRYPLERAPEVLAAMAEGLKAAL